MSIHFDDNAKIFTLHTAGSTYQMAVHPYGYLLHLYYGARVDGQDLSYLLHRQEFGLCPNPSDAGQDRTFSLDSQPLEYPCGGVGDYRISAVEAENPDGSRVVDFRYARHAVTRGKYALPGLPAFYEETPGEAETLSILLSDTVSGLEAELLYGVFEKADVITRAAVLTNRGNGAVCLTKIQSLNVDFPYADFDLLHFHGRHAMEREPERIPVMNGIQTVSSSRGTSSHQHNPGVILLEKGAGEDFGRCYGFNLVYSGNFSARIERDQTETVRVNIGLGGEGFRRRLEPGEQFAVPEAVMSFSDEGLSRLSHNFHRAVRHNLCRGIYKHAPRPVVMNNWEATYFSFTGAKLLEIAKEAAAIGADTFVMDDGWFGNRDSDRRGLGDWTANEAKLGCKLEELADSINALGMRFGIWFEPEMVNEDSDLYRAHPDWALAVRGRGPARSRGQLVLDLSREEVRAYLFQAICAVLDSANIEYVKWDMNRSICDWYSPSLEADRQGELPHLYMLGLYDLLEKLTSRYPHVLFEGCSGGGGRFDLGMLYYHPQIWTSDNTDPAARLKIQYGTSFFYPASSIAAHISASPNHQTGRSAPIETRSAAALYGAFGFELDTARMSAEDKDAARNILTRYRQHESLIREGRYYRLKSPYDRGGFTAWQYAAEDGASALLAVVAEPEANPPLIHIRLKGLCPSGTYLCGEKTYTGAALMNAGIALPRPFGDAPAVLMEFRLYT